MFQRIHGQPTVEVVPTKQVGPFLVRQPTVEVPRWWLTLKYLVSTLTRGIVWLMRHPITTTVTVVALYVWATLGFWALVGIVLGLVGIGAVWRWQHRASFNRWIWFPALGCWRRTTVYRRHWQATMNVLGLAVMFQDVEYMPTLGRVHATAYGDRVAVDMVSGQTPEQWERCANALAHTFGALACKVSSPKPRRLVLELVRVDTLAHTVNVVRVDDEPDHAAPAALNRSAMPVDLRALPLGVTENGGPWLLRLAGTHVLIAGASGAGKGSIIWGLIRALGPAVRSGHVELWGLDPKGGLELAIGEPLFARLEDTSYATMADLLERAVDRMDARTRVIRGVARSHAVTIDEPVIVIIIDELATLTAYLPDNAVKKRVTGALALLLSKGRAVGVHVVAAVQDPRKDIVALRDLFPTRIALRLTESAHVDMVLGDGARDRGALADLIAETAPGTAYVVVDGSREVTRGRAGYHSDDEIRAMARAYAPREHSDAVPLLPTQRTGVDA